MTPRVISRKGERPAMSDPLSTWNEGATKDAVLGYVDENGKDDAKDEEGTP